MSSFLEALFYILTVFFLTVTLMKTLVFYRKTLIYIDTLYKTIRNHGKRQVFRCDFNLKTKTGKRWILEQTLR
jgi:hypothetical protein